MDRRRAIADLLPLAPQLTDRRPITTFVVKVASRCNLKCSYCYMYEHADQSWKHQPKFISAEVTAALAERLTEYAAHRALKQISIVAHGGEPLLLGAKRLDDFFLTIRSAFANSPTRVLFGIQTNGTLVTDEIVEVLQRHQVRAGVSLDGPIEWNDASRPDKRGRGTFHRVLEGVRRLRNPPQGDAVFGGFLCVANPNVDAERLLTFFMEAGAPSIDLLLPEKNHDSLDLEPPGRCGKWLANVFDVWLSSGTAMEIRTFRTIMRLLLGGQRGYDAVGPECDGVMTVETDGSYHTLDILKTTYEGATSTGKAVFESAIAEMEFEPAIIALTTKIHAAPSACTTCDLFGVCGGGYLPHRYGSDSGFKRESVYCEDMKILIRHISRRLKRELQRASGKAA